MWSPKPVVSLDFYLGGQRVKRSEYKQLLLFLFDTKWDNNGTTKIGRIKKENIFAFDWHFASACTQKLCLPACCSVSVCCKHKCTNKVRQLSPLAVCVTKFAVEGGWVTGRLVICMAPVFKRSCRCRIPFTEGWIWFSTHRYLSCCLRTTCDQVDIQKDSKLEHILSCRDQDEGCTVFFHGSSFELKTKGGGTDWTLPWPWRHSC